MKVYSLVLIFLLTAIRLSAQSYILSPYSRYGLGELQNNTEVTSFAMGGLTCAFRDRYAVNSFNPASYTVMLHDQDSLPMLFNGGFKGNYSNQSSSSQKSDRTSGSLNSFSFAFKAAKHWALGFGLQPYSSVGYTLETSLPLDSAVDYIARYDGSGGFNKLWMGHAVKLFDHLSIGANVAYVFGSLSQTRNILFDSSAYYNTKVMSSRFVGDFACDLGLQYDITLKRDSLSPKRTHLIIGAAAGIPTELNAKESIYALRCDTVSGAEYVLDTVGIRENVRGTISMPMYLSGGFMFIIDRKGEKKNKPNEERSARWTIGVDFKMQDWSNFSSFGESDSLHNSFSVNAGFSVTPKNSQLSKYYEKMTWYGGLHYDNTYLSLKGEQLTKIGISFGCTFPLKPIYPKLQRSVLTTGIEFGKMGTTDQNLIEENYIRFVLGFSLKERWFEKKKYN